ncbi:CGNR zinc finger domain-containing protein [Streptomyces sp. NPDC006638]|uniref:CGNR zinc finger domain-containing protein n=1 Tax=Streptomyces sp. NPDC006638 TaxID=3157183 RepID=UPI0033A1F6F5
MQSTDPPAAAPPGAPPPPLGEPLPAELMNTVWADREGVYDALVDAGDLARWLRAVEGYFSPPLELDGPRTGAGGVSGPDGPPVERFRELRDALRRLAAVATEDTRPAAVSPVASLAAAVAAVNRACAHAPGWSHLSWNEDEPPARADGSSYGPEARALSRIAEESVLLFTGPGAAELRACHAPGCVRYFVRAHPRREWCSAGCGNRARVARHYRRHHPGGVS